MTKRILIVDDDEAVRETIRFVLGQAGHHCQCVPGGEQALELLKAGEKFDLVTTDKTNWPMDGLTFLDEIKHEFPDIPVLMLTARHDSSISSTCRSKGAAGFLLKPFNRQELLWAVCDIPR